MLHELVSLELAPPAATLRAATSGEGDEPAEGIAEVWLGRLDPDRGLFAMQPDRSTVYLLEASAAADLPISGEAYVANFAAPAPESEAPEAGAEGEPDPEAAATPEADPLEGVELP